MERFRKITVYVGLFAVAMLSACSPDCSAVPDLIPAQDSVEYWLWDGDPDLQAGMAVTGLVAGECLAIDTSDTPWLNVTEKDGSLYPSVDVAGLASGYHSGAIRLLWDDVELASVGVDVYLIQKPVAGARKKVLVIGWDGVRSDSAQFAHTPAMDFLVRRGAVSFDASTQRNAPTASGAGWGSILTGVESDRHNIKANDEFDLRDDTYPSFLLRAKRDLGLSTAASIVWFPLYGEWLELEGSVDWSGSGFDANVRDSMIEIQEEHNPDVAFLHLDSPDHGGHATGYGNGFPEYIAAIEEADHNTREILRAILRRPTFAEENWLFAMVTDHGGDGEAGHGALNEANRRIYVVAAHPDFAPVPACAKPTHMDIYPTVLAFLGAPAASLADLDGHVLGGIDGYPGPCE